MRKTVRGMPPTNRILKEFKEGEQVQIVIEPAVHEGMPHPRFQGVKGRVAEKRGRSYLVKIKDVNMEKLITSHPVHLRQVK